MSGYPVRQMYEEMAFLAYYVHWAPSDLMSLEHAERRRWCREVSAINERLNTGATRPIEAIG